LVVDDNADVLEMLHVGLQTLGFEVRTALDGPNALEIANEFRPDVVIVDLALPTMDGWELGRRLRELADCPRLIAITGFTGDDRRQRSLDAGFERHLIKPVTLRALKRALGVYPGGHSS
jgi:hypothetical protein